MTYDMYFSSSLNMVNGSWTAGHIRQLWQRRSITKVVYPPCDTSQFLALSNSSETRLADENLIKIISVAQFRPEKDHALQLKALRILLDMLKKKSVESSDWLFDFIILLFIWWMGLTLFLFRSSSADQACLHRWVSNSNIKFLRDLQRSTYQGNCIVLVHQQ